MRQVVERDVGCAALAALVAVLVVAIYDRWAWSRRRAAVCGRRELVLNLSLIHI